LPATSVSDGISITSAAGDSFSTTFDTAFFGKPKKIVAAWIGRNSISQWRTPLFAWRAGF
jgi:hypothetical protein